MNYKHFSCNGDIWDSLVGSQTVEEFLEESVTDDVEKAVDEYIKELPHMFPEAVGEFTEDYLTEVRYGLIEFIESMLKK